MSSMLRFYTILALALAAAISSRQLPAQAVAAARVDGSVTVSPRALRIQRAPGAIRIDAMLDDAGWSGAARVSGFVEREPREGARPPVETEVLLTYDERNLYVAWIARDPDPSRIRATLQPRDRIWSDDWVGILLEPFGGSSLGYYFVSNPIGVQRDLQATAQRLDPSIDFIYTTEGRITADGYIVEMAIPFSSLRFPDTPVQEWGIVFTRSYPRSSRHYITWPSISRNDPCLLCQLARLEGIEGVRPGGSLELLPSLVASQAGRLQDPSDPASFESGSVRVQPSLGLKYAFQSGWTAEATLNPDFSQVESDAAQVDVNTTFALFHPERRPFFQEGRDLYQMPLDVFYSRSINAPRGAVKLTGRTGDLSIGYVGARDEHTPFIVPFEERTGVLQAGRSTTNILRIRRNFGSSHVGALLADRRLDGGGSGTTASADARYRLSETYSVSGQLVLSRTQEPNDPELSASLPDLAFGEGDTGYTAAFDGESFVGHAATLWIGREARGWSWNALYLEASPTYRADAGFQRQNNFRRATVWTGWNLYPNRYGVERVTPSLFGGGYWNFQGGRQQALFVPGVSLILPRQTQLELNAGFREETFRGVRLTGIRDYSLSLSSRFSDALALGLNVSTGRRVARTLEVPEVGKGIDFRAWATIKPVQRVMIEPSLTYAELHRIGGEEIFRGYIARTALGMQFNRELNVRVILEYDDFRERLDLQPLLAYQLNPFSVFYVGSTHGSNRLDELGMVGTDRQYFAKVQYLFRR